MKKQWIALCIVATVVCFACACGGKEDVPTTDSVVNGGVQAGDNDVDWDTNQN